MSKIRDGLYGFIIGDAFGAYCEFAPREKLLEKPVTDMLGYGTFDVPEGTWTDDTCMTLATIDSIINKKKIDTFDIMTNFYFWVKEGRYTATGNAFDVGRTTLKAISTFSKTMDLSLCGQSLITDNGNGSLMRMLPIVYYCYYKKVKAEEIYTIVRDVSSLTHSNEISIIGCYIYVRFLLNILNGKDKNDAYRSLRRYNYGKYFKQETIDLYKRIIKEDITDYKVNDISSTGYVVDTLEAVMYVVMNSTKFSDAIIGAANLGDDTDTIAAIAGSIAGIMYGYDTFPVKWIFKLQRQDYLNNICETFEECLEKESPNYPYNYFSVIFGDHPKEYREQLANAGLELKDRYITREEFYKTFMDILELTNSEIIIKPIEEYMGEIDLLNDKNTLEKQSEKDFIKMFEKIGKK